VLADDDRCDDRISLFDRSVVWPDTECEVAMGTRTGMMRSPGAAIDAAMRRAETAIETVSDMRYHRGHKKEAARALASIESHKGKLTPATRKQAEDYAESVLGWSGYAPWLHVYSAVAGTFRPGWIPDNYYGKVVAPAVQGPYGEVSMLKPLSRRLFNNSDAFPDAAYFVNGRFYAINLEPIAEADLKSALFSDCAKVVFKIDNSARGKGVTVLESHNFDVARIKSEGNGVFQKYIEQHDFLSCFAPSSVATLRMTTAVDDAGQSTVRAVYLRVGRENETHVQSISNLRIAVDLEAGSLADEGYFPSWLTTDRHPDSKIKFAGSRIPAFAKCKATVLDLQRKMPGVHCIGWDVSVDKNDNVRIMEWNGFHNDIKFSEATQGPCFAPLKWERLAAAKRGDPMFGKQSEQHVSPGVPALEPIAAAAGSLRRAET
jgi:hypothetical protein